MQRWVVICCWAVLAVALADECPDGGQCKEGQTCCKHPTNGYECCPFDQAECCEDHVHCCPFGTFCDMDKSSCVNATASVPWAERAPAKQPRLSKSFRMIKSYVGEDEDNICPDQSHCPPEFSCLKALTKYGCCPLAQGVSCSDGKHCCPEGHSCSEDSHSCIKKDLVSTVMCSDGISECPEDSSCCQGEDGQFGCCPMPRAVCCEDKIHCCPEGSQCDLDHSKCISQSSKKELPMWAKFSARKRANWENQKEEEQHVTSETANEEKDSPTLDKPDQRVSNVSCDPTSACPDDTTCCSDGQGGWACCPYPQAVCCSDHQHCCPNGMTCDLAHQQCVSSSMSPRAAAVTTAASTTSTTESQEEEEDDEEEDEDDEDVEHRHHCGHNTTCPRNSTCCHFGRHKSSCCPLPKAVCCHDGKHCCPHHHKCNHKDQVCVRDDGVVFPWYTKLPALSTLKTKLTESQESSELTDTQEEEEDYMLGEEDDEEDDEDDRLVVHCDRHTSCPRGSTCCRLGRKWGCCPLPDAVCCSDGKHCCPHHHKCSHSRKACVRGGHEAIPWYTKLPALSSLETSANKDYVRCKDGNRCPFYNTCCQLSSGDYGCCPMENAVCCSDKKHCCPADYSCNTESELCERSIVLQVEFVPLTPAQPEMDVQSDAVIEVQSETVVEVQSDPGRENAVLCGGATFCPDGFTCCKLSTSFFCCQFPNGVCCPKTYSCCPAGYKCNDFGQCVANSVVPWDNWPFFKREKKTPLML